MLIAICDDSKTDAEKIRFALMDIADELEIVKNIVYQQMTNSFSLGEVPIDVHISYGKIWFEAHD